MPTKQIVASKSAPAAIGPYSQAVWAGNTLFASGQLPIDPATGMIVAGQIEEQARQALLNVTNVVEAAELHLCDVVKATVFLRDMEDFPRLNEVYASFFPAPCPARTCVQVARLPKDALVEIEVVAVRA